MFNPEIGTSLSVSPSGATQELVLASDSDRLLVINTGSAVVWVKRGPHGVVDVSVGDKKSIPLQPGGDIMFTLPTAGDTATDLVAITASGSSGSLWFMVGNGLLRTALHA